MKDNIPTPANRVATGNLALNPSLSSGDSDHPTPERLVEQLVALLRVRPLGDDRFHAQSEDIGTPAVFGGQVLGQAVMAVSATVADERPIHSLHGYFLLPGDPREPIDYVVERVRDGRSFSTRRVVAMQGDRTIFEMSASCQDASDGFEHQLPMPEVPSPDRVPSDAERRREQAAKQPGTWVSKFTRDRPIAYRWVDAPDLMAPAPRPAEAQIWMRTVAALPDEPALHRALLAYASDHGLLRAALLPHGLSFMQKGVRAASLDHAMWFHRPFRFDEGLLYAIDSPTAQGARALCRGSVFAHDGSLVASVAQEGMVRVRG